MSLSSPIRRMGAVSLLVSIHRDSEFLPSKYFDGKTDTGTEYPLVSFLCEFCRGSVRRSGMSYFDRFTTLIKDDIIVWTICFVKELLLVSHPNRHQVVIFRYCTRVGVDYSIRYELWLHSTQTKKKSRPELHVVSLPEYITTPNTAQEHLYSFIKDKYPTLVLTYATGASFSVFNTITCFKDSEFTDT